MDKRRANVRVRRRGRASANEVVVRSRAKPRTVRIARKRRPETLAPSRELPGNKEGRMHRVALAALSAALLFGADQPKAPVAGNPIVNISGKITRVDASRPGEMPGLVVNVEGTS